MESLYLGQTQGGLGRPRSGVASVRDNNPSVRSAGVNTRTSNYSVGSCFDVKDSDTPEKIQQYSKLGHVGQREKTPATFYDAEKTAPAGGFGMKTSMGESVVSTLSQASGSFVEAVSDQQAESRYPIAKTMRLGKGYTPGGGVPDKFRQNDTVFGLKNQIGESAKEVMYPEHELTPPVDTKKPAQDPVFANTRFGQPPSNLNRNGRKDLLIAGMPSDDVEPASALQAKQWDNRRIGVAARINDIGVSDDKVFGRQTDLCNTNFHTRKTETALAIHESTTEEGMKDDELLGRSKWNATQVKGRRPQTSANMLAQQSTEMAMGVPSIRTDLHEPSQRSITDSRNFGAEIGAVGCIKPDLANMADVLPPSQVRATLASVGNKYSDRTWEVLSRRADAYCPYKGFSIADIRRAIKEMGL